MERLRSTGSEEKAHRVLDFLQAVLRPDKRTRRRKLGLVTLMVEVIDRVTTGKVCASLKTVDSSKAAGPVGTHPVTAKPLFEALAPTHLDYCVQAWRSFR